jgi:hypothetical protein
LVNCRKTATALNPAQFADAEKSKNMMQIADLVADAMNTMWCKSCRQDVPALTVGDRQGFCCPRCGASVCTNPQQDAWIDDASGDKTVGSILEGVFIDGDAVASTPPFFDDWEMGEELREIGAALQSLQSSDRLRKSNNASTVGRRRGTAGLLVWTMLSLGTCGLVCGGILIIWSLAVGRQELWNIGLPTALSGQIALMIGLVLQIDRFVPRPFRRRRRRLHALGRSERPTRSAGFAASGLCGKL